MAVRVKTKDDFPLDPDAPRLQTMLRYTATGSEHRNDMQIFRASFSTPLGGDPFDEEGIRFTCMVELAQSAGELRLNPNDPHEQMFINCRYLEHPRDRERLREVVRIILDMMEHESFNGIVEELISPVEADLASDDTLDQWLLENVSIGQPVRDLQGGFGLRRDGRGRPIRQGTWGPRAEGCRRVYHPRLHPSQH